MKYFLHLPLLIVSFWVLTGCRNKSPEPTYSVNPLSNPALLDSIGKFDTLVNVTKPNNHVKSFSYAKQALALGMREHNPEVLAKAFILMGIEYINKRNDSSYFYFSEAMKIVEKFNLSGLKPYVFYNFSTLY
jgi:hypothetical protein